MECELKLKTLVYDKIEFIRLGIHSDKQLEVNFTVTIGTNLSDHKIKKVSLAIHGEKQKEYRFEIQASGFFDYEGDVDDSIIQQNAVAIIMPYIRSEVSILTAQPGVEPVVLPPFNIVEMMKKSSESTVE